MHEDTVDLGIRRGMLDVAEGRVTACTPEDLLAGWPGINVSRLAARLCVTDTWARQWESLDLTSQARGTVLSSMAGALREPMHPSLRTAPSGHGTRVLTVTDDVQVTYRVEPGRTVWIAFRQP